MTRYQPVNPEDIRVGDRVRLTVEFEVSLAEKWISAVPGSASTKGATWERATDTVQDKFARLAVGDKFRFKHLGYDSETYVKAGQYDYQGDNDERLWSIFDAVDDGDSLVRIIEEEV